LTDYGALRVEYISVMVGNHKTMAEMKEALEQFLGAEGATKLVFW
jgi:hypothetical protein